MLAEELKEAEEEAEEKAERAAKKGKGRLRKASRSHAGSTTKEPFEEEIELSLREHLGDE